MTTGKSKVVVQWPLPVKNGEKPCSVINWPAVVAHDFTVAPPLSVEQLYQPFERTFGAFGELPIEVQAKYRNTTDFINKNLIRHAKA